MVIGVDVDGVLANFVGPFIHLVNKVGPVQLPPQSDTYPTCWDFHKAGGVPDDQTAEVWRQILESRFFYNLPAIHGARQALQTLRQLQLAGHPVYFITSRPGNWAKGDTEDWLDVWGFSRATVVIADKKGPVADSLKLGLFVDDRPENCRDVAAASLTCKVCLIDAPYNRSYDPALMEYYRLVRVPSVAAALETCGEELYGYAKAA